jgi:hypothetical protein
MSRQVLCAGLALLSASAASACPPIFFRPYYCYPPVVVVPYYVPQPYYVVPQAAPAPRPPRVQVEPTKPGEFARPEPAKPTPPAPKQSAETTPTPGVKPADFKTTDSIPLPTPRPVTPETAVPKPAVPDFKIDPPAGAAPKADVPQLPAPNATKEPEGVKIPPLVPPLKGVPDPTVPPLAIPTPALGAKSSTSKSSPLADRPRVEVVPAEGSLRDLSGRRTVGFFNQSDRDVRLTVEGQTITLPKRHTVTAAVPATFAWKLDDGADETTTIPGAAPGVEVLIRR